MFFEIDERTLSEQGSLPVGDTATTSPVPVSPPAGRGMESGARE